MGWTEDYMAAWNSYDEDTWVAKFAPTGCYTDPGVGVSFEGESELRRMFRSTLEGFHDWHWEHHDGFTDDRHYSVEWTFTAVVGGTKYSTRGVSVGELDGDGLILENRDYWNLGDFPTFSDAGGRMAVEKAAYERRLNANA